MFKLSKLLEHQVDGVDLNCGCPQGIAKKGHYGAYLLEEPDIITGVIRGLNKELTLVPATCKIRKVNNEREYQDTLKLCHGLVAAGVSAITIHGRIKEEKGHHTKAADWEFIRILKATPGIGDRVPIFANGGIEDYRDVVRCFEHTRCDAVMSSEGLLEDPQLFAPLNNDVCKKYIFQCAGGARLAQNFTQIDPLVAGAAALNVAREYTRLSQDVVMAQYMGYAQQYRIRTKTAKSHAFHMLYAGTQSCPEIRAQVGQARTLEEISAAAA